MNKRLLYRILFLMIVPVVCTCSTYGQKPYHFKILLSGDSFDHSGLTINFYEGYEIQSIPVTSSDTVEEIQSSGLSFPVLEVFYYSSGSKSVSYRFFLLKQQSNIELYYDAAGKSLRVRNSSGVRSFANAGQDKFDEYAQKEKQDLDLLTQKYNYHFDTDSAYNQYSVLTRSLRDKSLEFMKADPGYLYDVWLFMQLLHDPNYTLDYLNDFYNRYFKKRYKNTFEGKFIAERLDKNRLGILTAAPYRNLPFKDLSGKTHTIHSFSGKPLIIMLWATWCGPCVAEIPKMKELYSLYKGKLELLSFSSDSNEKKMTNYISANNMEGINVFGRNDLCNIYGADKGIPQVFLLDKNGVIIYSRSALEDYTLAKLDSTLQKMFK